MKLKATLSWLAMLTAQFAMTSGAMAANLEGTFVLRPAPQWVTVQEGAERPRTMKVRTEFSGTLKIRRIGKMLFWVDLYGDRGYPSGNIGSFSEQLKFSNGAFVYKLDEPDIPNCSVKINIFEKYAKIDQVSEDPNFFCGFGHGVVVSGIYRKISSRRPVIRSH